MNDDIDILRLIEGANDTRDRAMLLVLHRMQRNLTANTDAATAAAATLQTHTEQLDTHKTLIERGRGGWKVLAVVGVLAYAVIGWVAVEMYRTVQSLQAQVVEVRIQQAAPRP